MIKVGITGQAGFVGTNLYNYLNTQSDMETIPFEDNYYENENKLELFVSQCDVIVHLAAVMRSPNLGVVYDTNMRLVRDLVNASNNVKAKPCILFASSIQETGDSEYAKCKREGAELLSSWCRTNGVGFCKMVFPNLFGPYAKPNYSSFIATFCYKLAHGEQPQVLVDNVVPLIYIGDLVKDISNLIRDTVESRSISVRMFEPQIQMKVTEVLSILTEIKCSYLDNGVTPVFNMKIQKDLFTTFKSYIDNGNS